MKYTIFDRLGCMPELARSLKEMGIDSVYPRVVLVGARCSGKTSLMKLLTGCDVPQGVSPYSAYLAKPGFVRGGREHTIPSKWSQLNVVEVPYDLDLVRKYIEPKSSVIVVVIAASKDLPRGLLDLVAEVDPAGERTVGVLSLIESIDTRKVANHIMCNDLELPFKLIAYSCIKDWCEGHAFFSNLPPGFAGLGTVIDHIGKLSSRVFCNHLQRPM